MQRSNRKLATYFLAALLALSNSMFASTAVAGSYNEVNSKPGGYEMVVDTFLIRPTMLVGTALGIIAFVGTLPFSALGGNVDEAAKTLVIEPAAYTFVRPLGDI